MGRLMSLRFPTRKQMEGYVVSGRILKKKWHFFLKFFFYEIMEDNNGRIRHVTDQEEEETSKSKSPFGKYAK